MVQRLLNQVPINNIISLHVGEYVLMCSCCGAGVLRAAVEVIPEFVNREASACACVLPERCQDGQPQLLAGNVS